MRLQAMKAGIVGRSRFIPLLASVLVFMTVGCSTTSRLQVRGLEGAESLENYSCEPLLLEEVEKTRCDDFCRGTKCRTPLACELWDRSLECLQDENGRKVSVHVVEFSDQGEVNEQQLMAALRHVQNVIKEHRRGVIVTFAHGWHHGPQVCDSNLACFRRVLMEVQEARKENAVAKGEDPNAEPAPVVGIYLGWRGEQYRSGLARWASLFNRKRAAQRIGRHGALEALRELDSLYLKMKKEYEEVRMVTVGHSLGGALVFTALQNKMLVEVGKQHLVRPVGGDLPEALGDAVVLVNPAVEAWEYRAFDRDMRERYKAGSESERPFLYTIGSSADWAVGVAFPISRVLLDLVMPWRISRGRSNLEGMGRYGPHITHDLKWSKPKVKGLRNAGGEPCGCPYPVSAYEERAAAGQSDYSLITRKPWMKKSPYWVIHTDASVIDDHNDIYNPRFVQFLIDQIGEFLGLPVP